ncbi:methyltransferase [Pseudaeromonas sharmana]|uniref:Methyltransferase n=1 Tax=Pseudaeromonas sharmana TaxID=328412 RepID=A0ABV8CQG3_9GAMM
MVACDLPLTEHFSALDQLLTCYGEFWLCQPFHWRDLCWRHSHPELCTALDELTLSHLQAMEEMPCRVQWLAPWLAHLPDLLMLCSIVQRQPELPALPASMAAFIPGRKWQQIRHFEAATGEFGLPFLEWCAGKGHLGRVLAWRRDVEVESLEWQSALCADGRALAQKQRVRQQFHCADAFAASSASLLRAEQHAVALHACGDLHVALLRQGVAAGVRAVTISPCCYHLIRDSQYQPLSQAGQASRLQLSRNTLRLAAQETVTAGARERRLRDIELRWRLAFDLLQRAWRGEDSYLPLPTLPGQLLTGDFATFVAWALERKGLAVARPSQQVLSQALCQAEARVPVVARMEWVRHLFRRPLELWLVLDRALYLQEQGYQVSISEFCGRALTPRNLLLEAWRAR